MEQHIPTQFDQKHVRQMEIVAGQFLFIMGVILKSLGQLPAEVQAGHIRLLQNINMHTML